MNCPTCGKRTFEKGNCTECQPFNIYLTKDVSAFLDNEELRLLILEYADEIRQIGCGQVHCPFEEVDPSTPVKTCQANYKGVELAFLPCIDTAGYESVCVGIPPRKEVKDGWHRVFFSNN